MRTTNILHPPLFNSGKNDLKILAKLEKSFLMMPTISNFICHIITHDYPFLNLTIASKN